MNLFILDTDPVLAAQENCDAHVCKIILEACQMLMLAHIELAKDGDPIPVWNAKSQRNNHVSKWVRENESNYDWTLKHGLALCDEYTYRYKKVHKTQALLEWCKNKPRLIPAGPMTAFRQAVAEDCYNDDVVEAYRQYYVKYKSGFAKWTKRPTPQWFIDRTSSISSINKVNALKTDQEDSSGITI